MAKRVRSLRCPTCKKLVLRTDPDFPFCSERCRLIDLGKWASGSYVVSTPIADPDSAEVPDLSVRRKSPDSTKTDQNDKRERSH
jgi:endogenous inhibitor of DNA gyrase (YacG/DUF329 family)